MIFLHRRLTIELTELIDRIGRLIATGNNLTDEELLDLREWLKAARTLHHKELREARAGGISLRQGANVVPLSDFQRAERAYLGMPCDTEGAA